MDMEVGPIWPGGRPRHSVGKKQNEPCLPVRLRAFVDHCRHAARRPVRGGTSPSPFSLDLTTCSCHVSTRYWFVNLAELIMMSMAASPEIQVLSLPLCRSHDVGPESAGLALCRLRARGRW